ncbi:hypothetical protein I5M32_15950 [Pedobacter sp. SD-b]|uniref:Outer membrane protein TolC n=1 Tax=Pedobacter segetis TaxID=2793069 RepID=A0ABS1BPX9_9SPHI|nr:hypothetical protein [Pedobacter segetis]MBK0384459.1 hypothetical protein [Pedobacter segetis]
MNKTSLKMMLCMLSIPIALQAQLSPKVKQQYPALVVAKVFDVASKIKLPEDRQLALANYYKKQDSLGVVALAKGEPMETVSDYYNFYPKAVLSAEDWNDYVLITLGSNLKLRHAIKYRDDLKLSKTELENLLLALENAKQKMHEANFNITKFDAEQLPKILGTQKHRQLLSLFYHEKAVNNAREDYHRTLKYNLITVADSLKKVNEFYNYELAKLIEIDLVAQSGDYKKIDSVKKTQEINKPQILWKANALAAKLPHAKLTELVNYRKEVGLSANQVDTLVTRIIQLEKTKFYEQLNNPYGYFTATTFETENILRILTKPQLETYLSLKNKNKAIYNTQKNWQKLKALNLVKDADSVTINREHEAYELKYLVANQILLMEKSQRNAFNRLTIQNTKPPLLKQLDALATEKAATANTKKQLAW